MFGSFPFWEACGIFFGRGYSLLATWQGVHSLGIKQLIIILLCSCVPYLMLVFCETYSFLLVMYDKLNLYNFLSPTHTPWFKLEFWTQSYPKLKPLHVGAFAVISVPLYIYIYILKGNHILYWFEKNT